MPALTNTVGQFRSGKGGRVKVGSTFMTMNEYSVAESGQDLDTTNFECFTLAYGNTGNTGRSFSQGLIGVETAQCQTSGLWNAAQNPFVSPPGIYLREDGPATLLSPNRVDNNYYNFLATKINACGIQCSITGLVTFNWSYTNQGPYVRPIGNMV